MQLVRWPFRDEVFCSVFVSLNCKVTYNIQIKTAKCDVYIGLLLFDSTAILHVMRMSLKNAHLACFKTLLRLLDCHQKILSNCLLY